jgi:hypothetical protein
MVNGSEEKQGLQRDRGNKKQVYEKIFFLSIPLYGNFFAHLKC